MSIAGRIERVHDVPEGYELELTGMVYDQGSFTTVEPGQSHLTIIHPTWRPEIGMLVWGGSDSVIIEAEPRRRYDRVGYTRLKEG